MDRFIGILGFAVLLGISYLLSNNKSKISKKIIVFGIGMQVVLALLTIGVPALGFVGPLRFVFESANSFIISIIGFTNVGSEFIFGDLVKSDKMGFIVAFQILPTIIFFSSLMSVFYHLGIMQKIINSMALLMQKTLGTSGAESLSMAANVFVGQTEAPLAVKPYVNKMTSSELFALMTGGMATVAGGVLATYVGLLKDTIPQIGGHLLTASLMSAPAAFVFAKIFIPEVSVPETATTAGNSFKPTSHNIIDAAAQGAGDGLKLAVNVGAMLLAFIALIAFANAGLEWIGEITHLNSLLGAPLTLQLVLGWLFAPMAWLMGIPWSESMVAGSLLGEKIVINEFVAYLHMSSTQLSERTMIILSYALCGFANFSSIAIQIGGIGGIAPGRKKDLAKFGIRSVIAGSFAAFSTAIIASLLI